MPALVDQPGVLRVHYGFQVSEDTAAACRLYLKNTGTPPSNANCVTMATAIGVSYGANLKAFAHPDVILLTVRVTDLTSPTSGDGVASPDIAGTEGGTPNAANVCSLINLQIGRRYRGGKPRIYFPFFTSSDLFDENTWKAASLSGLHVAFQNHVDDLLALATGGVTISGLVNVSYYSGAETNPSGSIWAKRNVPKPRTVAVTPDPVVNFSVNPNVASQRRRTLIRH